MGNEVKVLGFWDKVTTECVSLNDYTILVGKFDDAKSMFMDNSKGLNDKIDNLTSELSEANVKLDSITFKLKLKETELSDVEQEVNDLKAKLNSKEERISELETANISLKAKEVATVEFNPDDYIVKIAALEDELKLEKARREIKSTRKNNALKRDEVLAVVEMAKTKTIVEVAVEMNLTIDSIEKIISGESYSKYTGITYQLNCPNDNTPKVKIWPSKQSESEDTLPAAEEDAMPEPLTILIGRYNTASRFYADSRKFIVGNEDNFRELLSKAFPSGPLINIGKAAPIRDGNETHEQWIAKATTLEKEDVLFKVGNLTIKEIEQDDETIEYPILELYGEFVPVELGDGTQPFTEEDFRKNEDEYTFAMRCIGRLEDLGQKQVIQQIICWDLTTKTEMQRTIFCKSKLDKIKEEDNEDAPVVKEIVVPDLSKIEEELSKSTTDPELPEPVTDTGSKLKRKKRLKKNS